MLEFPESTSDKAITFLKNNLDISEGFKKPVRKYFTGFVFGIMKMLPMKSEA